MLITLICPNCGYHDPEAKKCPRCGTVMTSAEKTSAEPVKPDPVEAMKAAEVDHAADDHLSH